ncbi:MAG TPA: AMP-binding protein [Candidatus Borkfalkia faecipullorum]|uniref:AMP-binding protein n=1 Tax=Candidatus Borkfalkia faecipullorum TaxID=2838510 RepID=A0A9D2AG78_9FIRM|nr:AMP-binding protein [Candidatus Borkfalkia faecipullorum]
MNLLSRFSNAGRFRDYKDFYNNFRLNVPENFNYAYDVVDEYARLEPNKRALVWCDDRGEERIFTFADIKRLSDKTANYFLSKGIGEGDCVLVILQRRYEYWTVLMALAKIGAIAIPATHMLMEKDLVYRMDKAGVKMVVSVDEDELCENILKAAKKVPSVQLLACVSPREGFLPFDEEVKAQSEVLETPYKDKCSRDDIILLYFTSGTTGMPKMVTLSERYTLGHIVTARYWLNCQDDGLHFTLAETGWAKASWGKLFGQWLCGSAIFVYDFHGKFEPGDLLEHIEKYKITTFCAPPTVYRFMMKTDLSKYDLSSIKYMMTAGEALNPEIYRQIRLKTGHPIYEGFGQTETTIVCGTFSEYMEIRPGSMGKPSPLYYVQILDDEGNPVEQGETGEICIRLRDPQDGIFSGYYEDSDLTRTVIYDGYYHLGDLAYCDSDGYYWFVGRKDDIIKSSGYRIGPFEVESALMEHPAVLECAITGVPDTEGVRGQLVKATVVLTKGYEPSEQLVKELQTHVKKTTAPYKYPRVVEFVTELPKTISGKIRRVEIRDNDTK